MFVLLVLFHFYSLQCFLFCVFASQSLSTLTVLEDFLSKRPMPEGIATSDGQNPNWVRNLNYYSESSDLLFLYNKL